MEKNGKYLSFNFFNNFFEKYGRYPCSLVFGVKSRAVNFGLYNPATVKQLPRIVEYIQ